VNCKCFHCELHCAVLYYGYCRLWVLSLWTILFGLKATTSTSMLDTPNPMLGLDATASTPNPILGLDASLPTPHWVRRDRDHLYVGLGRVYAQPHVGSGCVPAHPNVGFGRDHIQFHLDLVASLPSHVGLDATVTTSMLDLDASTPSPTLGLDVTGSTSIWTWTRPRLTPHIIYIIILLFL